jgi:hypothetical protein
LSRIYKSKIGQGFFQTTTYCGAVLTQKNPKYIRKNKSDTGKGNDDMKELKRKVIPDNYEYKYKGKTIIKNLGG